MKKIFTFLSVAFLHTAFGQLGELSTNASSTSITNVSSTVENKTADEYTLIQYSSSDSRNNLVSCTSAAGTLNHFSRLYDLSAEGITSDFTVTSVKVMGNGQEQGGANLDVNFAEIDGAYTAANITAGLSPVKVSKSFPYAEMQFADIPVTESVVIKAGKKLAVGISTILGAANGSYNKGVFLGNNEAAQTAPSYIGWPGTQCVNTEPTDIVSLGYKQSMIFHVTGTTATMGTVELGSNKLAVYPNPATTEVVISLKDAKIAKVDLADVTGRVIPVKVDANGKVNVSALAKGVYFLRVQDTEGVTRIQKIIKK